MYLGTRLLTLLDDLTPAERTEVSLRVLRTRGNVFFWLERQAPLARQYYGRALSLLQASSQASLAPSARAHIGDVDHDVSDCLANLRLSHADLEGARDQLDRYRTWAEDVGASEHLATAAYKQALVEVVGATALERRGMKGNLDDATRLLDIAIGAPWASYPELRLRALLLRRWVAARRPGDDPAEFDDELRLEQQQVWGGLPGELADDPEALLLCDVMMDAPWWVVDQCDGRQLPAPLAVAVAHHKEFVYDDGRELDLAEEMRARVKARVSHQRFRERIEPVADQVERLCAIHFADDVAMTRALRCAAWVHDGLCEASEAELERLMEGWAVEADPLEHAHPWWLHGRLGYLLVEREFSERFERESTSFKEELRQAAEYHTWPGPGMSRSSKVFYVASQLVTIDTTVRSLRDRSSPLGPGSPEAAADRVWPAVQLRVALRTRDHVERLASEPTTLDQAMLSGLEWELARRRARGLAIHPRSIELLTPQLDSRATTSRIQSPSGVSPGRRHAVTAHP